jgi:hypothetical protein
MACCSHEHDCEAESCGASSLHEFINHAGVTCLNAADADAAKAVLRPWHERRLRTRALESLDEGEPELLLHIPFTTDVKARRYAASCVRCRASDATHGQLRGIVVSGGGGGSSPVAMRAFINRDDVDFSLAAELTPVQEWSLVEDATASVEYATRFSKFQSVSSLTLHFPSNGGAACTRIFFIGLRGEARGVLLACARLRCA